MICVNFFNIYIYVYIGIHSFLRRILKLQQSILFQDTCCWHGGLKSGRSLPFKKFLTQKSEGAWHFIALCKASSTMEHSHMMKASGFYHKRNNKSSLILDQIISLLFAYLNVTCRLNWIMGPFSFFFSSLSLNFL